MAVHNPIGALSQQFTAVVFYDATATTIFQRIDLFSPVCFLSPDDTIDLLNGRMRYTNADGQYVCSCIVIESWNVLAVLPADRNLSVQAVGSPQGTIANHSCQTSAYIDQHTDPRFTTAQILANSYVSHADKLHIFMLEQVIAAGMHSVVPGTDASTAEIRRLGHQKDARITALEKEITLLNSKKIHSHMLNDYRNRITNPYSLT